MPTPTPKPTPEALHAARNELIELSARARDTTTRNHILQFRLLDDAPVAQFTSCANDGDLHARNMRAGYVTNQLVAAYLWRAAEAYVLDILAHAQRQVTAALSEERLPRIKALEAQRDALNDELAALRAEEQT